MSDAAPDCDLEERMRALNAVGTASAPAPTYDFTGEDDTPAADLLRRAVAAAELVAEEDVPRLRPSGAVFFAPAELEAMLLPARLYGGAAGPALDGDDRSTVGSARSDDASSYSEGEEEADEAAAQAAVTAFLTTRGLAGAAPALDGDDRSTVGSARSGDADDAQSGGDADQNPEDEEAPPYIVSAEALAAAAAAREASAAAEDGDNIGCLWYGRERSRHSLFSETSARWRGAPPMMEAMRLELAMFVGVQVPRFGVLRMESPATQDERLLFLSHSVAAYVAAAPHATVVVAAVLQRPDLFFDEVQRLFYEVYLDGFNRVSADGALTGPAHTGREGPCHVERVRCDAYSRLALTRHTERGLCAARVFLAVDPASVPSVSVERDVVFIDASAAVHHDGVAAAQLECAAGTTHVLVLAEPVRAPAPPVTGTRLVEYRAHPVSA